MRRNFTTFIEEWKTQHNVAKFFKPEWRDKYKSIVAKFIKEKYKDPDFYQTHLVRTVEHMIDGDHSQCNEFYCNKEKVKNLPKIDFDKLSENDRKNISEAKEHLKNYLKIFAKRCSRIKNVTSNIVECLFSVNTKFQAGKIKNLLNGTNYRIRC